MSISAIRCCDGNSKLTFQKGIHVKGSRIFGEERPVFRFNKDGDTPQPQPQTPSQPQPSTPVPKPTPGGPTSPLTFPPY